MDAQKLSSDWARQFHCADAGAPRLVCFPHAGGAASAFFRLSAELSPAVEVLAVQYPGRQDRRYEPLIDDIGRLADQIHRVSRIEGWVEKRPMAFFGHSMGAIVAFEVARRLESKDGTVLRGLFVSARGAPSRFRPEAVHRGDDESLLAKLAALDGTDARLLGDEEIRELVLPICRSDYRAIETYRYRAGPRLLCPLTVLLGDADPLTPVDEARAWENHTTEDADMRIFPGGHFYNEANQAGLVRVITDRLGVSQPGTLESREPEATTAAELKLRVSPTG
jgi:surfactin synthase thioesterase subunit